MTNLDDHIDDDPSPPRRRPVRVGIAGLGRSALLGHIPVLESLSDLFSITAVCDLMKERRDIVERNHPDVHTYRRVEDMLDDPDVEVVLVSLPSVEHQSTVLESLARTKWTVVDPPLALSHDDALVLRAAAIKARGKLIPFTRGLFAPDYRLALMALDDPRLGELYEVRVRRQDYIRRDDWQAVKRCGGGAAYYSAQDALLQAVGLLRSPPSQLWSELKRVASLGDAEDFAHIVLKTRGDLTADIEINGGMLPPFEPVFTLRGSRGSFSVQAGASEGVFHVIDPEFQFPRRRSSVRTPSLADLHESFPVLDIPFALPPDAEAGDAAFWRALYNSVRVAAPFPAALDDAVEAIRYLHIVKRSSPFAK
jgi:predicted dehydrogenase